MCKQMLGSLCRFFHHTSMLFLPFLFFFSCSFEQVEPGRRVQEAARQVASLVAACSQHLLAVGAKASSSSDSALAAVLRQCKALQVQGPAEMPMNVCWVLRLLA